MRGIIYCIKQKEKGYDSPIYIGSTKDFNKREGTHKSDCNNPNSKSYNYKVYQYLRENGGWDNFKMLEIGMVEYETDEELRIEEQKWIEDLGPTLNDKKSYRTIEDKKELNRQCRKRYYKKHKETVLEKMKEKIKCECGSIINKSEIARHRKSKKHIKNIL